MIDLYAFMIEGYEVEVYVYEGLNDVEGTIVCCGEEIGYFYYSTLGQNLEEFVREMCEAEAKKAFNNFKEEF